MIITLTGNLLAERTFLCEGWSAGRTQRALSESFQVGGKGINVTKMLARIGESTTAWGFAGGSSGDECAGWLRQVGLSHRLFPTAVPTRTGLVVRGGDNETTFLGPDRVVDAAAFQACAEALDQALVPGAWLAICGSFPGWDKLEAAPLREAVARWGKASALVVDTYGPPLKWSLQQPALLVKINRDEFDGLFSEAERVEAVGARITQALARWPVRAWIVSDGAGTVHYGGRESPLGSIQPPKVKEVSATGSGDVLFACLLHALHTRQQSLSDALTYALPFAAANAAHPGIAEFDLNNLPSIRSFQP